MDTLDLDLHQLNRRHADLRIVRPPRDARLVASLAEHGQNTPVLVRAQEEEAGESAPGAEATRYVLIDGYRRVRALEVLGRDRVRAICTTLRESEALLWHHQLESRGRRSALEEGWLLYHLHVVEGISRDELAKRLACSKGWLSGRLALVKILPEKVQTLVRQGQLCAHAAQKYLVPIARISADDCETIASKLASNGLSTRDMQRIYIAWRQGNQEQRRRIIEHPDLLVAAATALETQPSEPSVPGQGATTSAQDIESDGQLCRALDELSMLSSGLCRSLAARDRHVEPSALLQAAWSRAIASVAALAHYLEAQAYAG